MTEVVSPPSFVGGLGIELWIDDDRAHGRVEVAPSFLKPGTWEWQRAERLDQRNRVDAGRDDADGLVVDRVVDVFAPEVA